MPSEKFGASSSAATLTRDEVLYDATLRNLQTLSEATQRLPDAIKLADPEIPRKQIGGFRNILVHNHLGDIDAATVLAVVNKHLPPLEASRAPHARRRCRHGQLSLFSRRPPPH